MPKLISKPDLTPKSSDGLAAETNALIPSHEINVPEPVRVAIKTVPSVPGDDYAGRFLSLVDLNLVSGSGDTFRNSIGGYFFNQLTEEGDLSVPPPFKVMHPLNNINQSIYSISSYTGDSINSSIELGETGIDTDPEDAIYAAKNLNTILPYSKFVCHIEGNPNYGYLQNISEGNHYWLSLFTGQDFNGQTVSPIYNQNVYDEHYTYIMLPYKNIDIKTFSNGAHIRSYSEIGYDYNLYDPLYQVKLNSLNSEKEMPNWYILNILGEEDTIYNNQDIIQYYGNLSADQSVDSLNLLAKQIIEPDSNSMENMVKTVNNFNSANIALKESINRQQTNLLFNSNATSKLLVTDSNTNINSHLMPFYTKFKFVTEKSKTYVQVIKNNSYSTNFLKTLKEVFLNQTENQLPLEQTQFLVNERFLSSSVEEDIDVGKSSSRVETFKGVDFTEFLLYSHNTIKNENDDFTIMDHTSLEVKSAKDTSGAYRAFNTRNTLRIMNSILGKYCAPDAAFYISDINTIMNIQQKSVDGGITAFESVRPQSKYNEVLAYRIEKIGGPAVGDGNTQNTIQNFWIFNDDSLDVLNMIDTQCMYNTDYTYKIYAYYAVNGMKYKFSNLQLTRIVGNVRENPLITSDGGAETGIDASAIDTENPIKGYCIEYYDPYTGEIKTDLLADTIGEVEGASEGIITSLAAEDTVRIRVSGAGTADNPQPPYFANFVVTVQPSLKLIEVPVHTKEITITDHIPNKVNITPSYVLNNSNKLIFNLAYETFQNDKYPKLINPAESIFKEKYLRSNDITGLNKLEKPSVSPPRFVDVYKIDHFPRSYEDFNGNLVATIDNKIEDKNYAYTTCKYSDIVKSNTKYYYLFKVRNDLNISGVNSEIVEAELINDGGYKYASFGTVNEEDMVVDKFKRTTEKIKKIIQVIPNFSQLEIDDTGVDYQQTALSQYDKVKIGTADDLIWNKVFKLRLTSKKTGKKIDLNITYSDPSVNLDE